MDGHFGAIFARTFGVANERDEAKTRNARLDCNHRIVSLLFHHQLGWILTVELLSFFLILIRLASIRNLTATGDSSLRCILGC